MTIIDYVREHLHEISASTNKSATFRQIAESLCTSEKHIKKLYYTISQERNFLTNKPIQPKSINSQEFHEFEDRTWIAYK